VTRPPPPPPAKADEAQPLLQARVKIEEIPNDDLAADLCKRILRAQARTAARQRKERRNDAA